MVEYREIEPKDLVYLHLGAREERGWSYLELDREHTRVDRLMITGPTGLTKKPEKAIFHHIIWLSGELWLSDEDRVPLLFSSFKDVLSSRFPDWNMEKSKYAWSGEDYCSLPPNAVFVIRNNQNPWFCYYGYITTYDDLNDDNPHPRNVLHLVQYKENAMKKGLFGFEDELEINDTFGQISWFSLPVKELHGDRKVKVPQAFVNHYFLSTLAYPLYVRVS